MEKSKPKGTGEKACGPLAYLEIGQYKKEEARKGARLRKRSLQNQEKGSRARRLALRYKGGVNAGRQLHAGFLKPAKEKGFSRSLSSDAGRERGWKIDGIAALFVKFLRGHKIERIERHAAAQTLLRDVLDFVF
jgi:hypothetical protein